MLSTLFLANGHVFCELDSLVFVSNCHLAERLPVITPGGDVATLQVVY